MLRLFTFTGTLAYQCSLCILLRLELCKTDLVDFLHSIPGEDTLRGQYQCNHLRMCTLQESVLVLIERKKKKKKKLNRELV